jgi:SAM-dependent methyltransferase
MLDNPGRYDEIRRKIRGKPALERIYLEVYREYQRCLQSCPPEGDAIELGSGAGFAKELIPELLTSDVLPYQGTDRIIDGTRLPCADRSLRMLCMMNVFHHIPDVEAFLSEAERCLVPGGKIFIADQHVGLLSRPVFKYLHHEPFRPGAKEWSFQSAGPLSDANGALAWIVFVRDLARFRRLYPGLKLLRYQPHTPLRYWLSGGLKQWSLIPRQAVGLVEALDRLLIRIWPELGSFVYIELVKR